MLRKKDSCGLEDRLEVPARIDAPRALRLRRFTWRKHDDGLTLGHQCCGRYSVNRREATPACVHPLTTPGSIDDVDVTFIYMMFVLKIPIVALLWIVWWAIHQTPEPQSTGHDDGGTKPTPHPHSPLPHVPRRGPHGDPPPPAPARVRVPARARSISRD